MTYPPPKALLRLPPSRNKQVRSGIAATRSLLRRNQFQQAAAQLQQIQPLEPGNVEVALLQAELLTRSGQHDRSCQLLKQILAHQPGLVPALALSASAHTAAHRHLAALDAIQLAHDLAPDNQDIARQLVSVLGILRRPAAAARILARVIRKSKHDGGWAQLATLYDRAGQLDACLAAFDRVSSSHSDLKVLKAGAMLMAGDGAQARKLVDEALSQAPDNASLRLFIAKNFAVDFPPAEQAEQIQAILAADKSASLTSEDRARLQFALGLAHERIGSFTDAFHAIDAANRQIAPKDFASEQQLEQVALGIADHFSKARLAQLAPAGHPSRQPVFVTGLPRSGTTLVEQFIARHPDAGSVGELELIPALRQSLVSLQPQDIRRCAEAWLAAVPEANSAKARIVDKSISTSLYAGLAMLMFPNSRLVFLHRHPMDIFWSAYREMFAVNALTFTYAAEALVRRIKFSHHIMGIWQKRFPDRVLTVRYEDIVSAPEHHSRRIIAHTGLDWDDRCLDFHNADTVVRTASMTQVREPVYKSSVGKWQVYRSHLSPVADALTDLITDYEKDLT